MSKIGKLPIDVAEGVTVVMDQQEITVTGSKGTITYVVPSQIQVNIKGNIITVLPKVPNSNALFGLVRALIANMVNGVSEGFEKKLELSGVGYRAMATPTELSLSVGFSHPVKIQALPGIQFTFADNIITVSGADKILVGDTAAKIRSVRPPEPYKGKGILYKGEKVRRKAGKSAKAVGVK